MSDQENLFDIPAVEGPEYTEENELTRDLTPRLKEDVARELAHRLAMEFSEDISDRIEWENRLKDWDDLYYGRVSDKDFPWPGASNFHVPITMLGIETYKPRLMEAILGQSPPIIVVPTTPAGEEKRLKVETLLNWQVISKLKLDATVTQSAHLFLHPGIVIAKTYWHIDRKWRKFVREFPVNTPIPNILESLFGTDIPQNVKSTGTNRFTAQIKAPYHSGGPLEIKLRIKVLEENIQVLVEREEITEGPRVDLIDPIDIIVPAKGGAEPHELPHIKHRIWMFEGELRDKARLGRFYPDVVEKILADGTPKGDDPPIDCMGYRDSQDQAEGIEGYGASNVKAQQYEIIEDYRREDLDDDGIEEEVIVWTCQHAPDDILGWDYLDNVYAHGRRPFRIGRFHPIPFRFYPLSFAEVVKGIQDEINAIHNQKVDYATIQNLPFGFKRASATLPPIQQRIKPGEFIDVDNPQQDILIPKWQGTPAWGQQEEATLMQYFERLMGVNDLILGRQPNRVGATRTAKGTQTLLSEAGLRFKIVMQAFQLFWTGIFEDILALDQEYLPPALELRITGKRPGVVRLKDRSEIKGQFDLRIATTSDSMNRGQMREDATILMQIMMNPMGLQAGIVGLKGVRRAYEDMLKAYGKDPDFYLEDIAPVLSPQEELMRFIAGVYVSPAAGENIPRHLQEHQMSMADPMLPPDVKLMLRKHIGETIQLGRTMMLAQGAGANGKPAPVGQQATNAKEGAKPQGPGQPTNKTPPSGGMTPASMGGNPGG